MKSRQEIIPYGEVFHALNRAKINYVVCGGAAVVLFGFARLTIDLDLIVDLEKANLEKLYDVLKQLNYRFAIPAVPTISINDLIKMKEDLGRKQDLIDVENLKRIKERKHEKNKL